MDIEKLKLNIANYLTENVTDDCYTSLVPSVPEVAEDIYELFVRPAINRAYEVSARIALDNLADDKWATCSGIAKLIREEKIK